MVFTKGKKRGNKLRFTVVYEGKRSGAGKVVNVDSAGKLADDDTITFDNQPGKIITFKVRVFDGDADRLIMVDESGTTCNGDVLILLIAKYLSSTNQLKNDVVVSTAMSNFGFKNSIEKNNFKNIETAVGDKYVAEAMIEHNASIGGEQSGHIIISDKLPVGDGLLTLIYSLKALSFFKTQHQIGVL